MTCVVAIVSLAFIVDFPELAVNTMGFKFLNEKEVAFVVARIEKDRHDVTLERSVRPVLLKLHTRAGS